jgi:hypothetical protein
MVYVNKAAADTGKKVADFFQNEFANEKPDTSAIVSRQQEQEEKASLLSKAKLFDYRLKFSSDFVQSGITNTILINRYQPYGGGSGPIQLNNGANLNFAFKVGVSDLMEDLRFIGGFRFWNQLNR